MKYSSSVNNYRETPYIVSDTFANIGNYTATIKGAIYVARDGASLNEPSIFQANGTSWVAIGGYGIGTDATLQDVTTNGKTTNQGITVTAGGVSTNTLTVTSLTPKSITFVGTADLITEDNTNLVWDNVNKWIGIQTNVPTAEVDIHTTTATPAIVINNTSGLASRIGFQNTNVSKWTIGNSATNTFNFYNSVLASIAAYLDGADNSATFNGSVQVLGSGAQRDVTSNLNAGILDATATLSGVKTVARFSNKGSQYITKLILSDTVNADCAITFQPNTTIANSTFGIGINSFENFVLKGNGSVGIGTNTPTNRLSVADDNITDVTPDSGNLYVYTTGAVAANAGGKIMLGGTYTGTTKYGFAAISGRNSSGSAGVVNGYLSFVTHNNSTGDAERMRLTDLGNLLIGSSTDDTTHKLQVTGSANFTRTTANSRILVTATGVANTVVGFNNSGATVNGVANNSAYIACLQGYPLIFSINDSEKMRIADNSDVTISNLAGTGSRAVLASATGVLSAPVSDQLVKENVQPLQYGLDTIMQLNPVQFEYIDTYKNYGEGLQIGNIAQDVEKIIPEAVFVTPSTGLKGIDYNQFNGIYIKAIQEQQEIIQNLMDRIDLLENKY